MKPDEKLIAPSKNAVAVKGSEDPNHLVVLVKQDAKADKFASLLYEEIVDIGCYEHKSTQYAVFKVKLTAEASKAAHTETVWSSYMGLTSTRASYLKLLEFV